MERRKNKIEARYKLYSYVKFDWECITTKPATFYINLGTPYAIGLKNRWHQLKADEDGLILRNADVTRHILPSK